MPQRKTEPEQIGTLVSRFLKDMCEPERPTIPPLMLTEAQKKCASEASFHVLEGLVSGGLDCNSCSATELSSQPPPFPLRLTRLAEATMQLPRPRTGHWSGMVADVNEEVTQL